MSHDPILRAYSAAITVQFTQGDPFKGKVYIQGDGSHAVFDWPDQANTPTTEELAEFATQTKWVTTGGKCTKSAFTPPDPNFVGMVSHAGYTLESSKDGFNTYKSGDITCTYVLDQHQREVIASIAFPDAEILFTNVLVAPQDPNMFLPPSDYEEA